MADESPKLHLFEGFGVELEYMIVDRSTGAVLPVSDRLIEAASGEIQAEIEMGELCWSNELVLHAIELKTNGPAPALEPLAGFFTRDVSRMAELLRPLGGTLMPTAMHPLMDPTRETRLWPHDYGEVYQTFDRMFDCRGHGWSNLQSTHLNLPYQGDEEFGRLHAAIRVLLPVLPALAASSPIVEGRVTGIADNRLEYYRGNCSKIPIVTGGVIPEPVFSQQGYRDEILAPIAEAVAPYDDEEVLDPEWVNARGAIARLKRESIEIRVLDVQEHPAADIAIVAFVVELLRGLTEERWSSLEAQQALSVERLEPIFVDCVRRGSRARIEDADYLAALGARPAEAAGVWQQLLARARPVAEREEWLRPLKVILEQGTLTERIVLATRTRSIRDVYEELSRCLMAGVPFEAS